MMETRFPELIPNVSTARSCVEMLGSLVRRDHPNAYIVEIMPCTAKKVERMRSGVINLSLTVVEVAYWFRAAGVTD